MLQCLAEDKAGELVLNGRVFGQGISNEVLEGQASGAFQYTGQAQVDAAPLDQGVMERFSVVELADTATEALKLERKGERERASILLNQSINRNRPHISPQAAAEYQSTSERLRAGMTEEERKRDHWEYYNRKRNKKEEEDK